MLNENQLSEATGVVLDSILNDAKLRGAVATAIAKLDPPKAEPRPTIGALTPGQEQFASFLEFANPPGRAVSRQAGQDAARGLLTPGQRLFADAIKLPR